LDSTSCRLTTWVESSPIFFWASSMRISRSRRSVTIWPVAFSVRSSRSATTLPSACSCSRSERSTRWTVSACWLSARASCWRMVSASPLLRRVSASTSTTTSNAMAASNMIVRASIGAFIVRPLQKRIDKRAAAR
jgi:hypothetical protein